MMDRVLTLAEVLAVLGLRSKSAFYRDPTWPTLLTRPSRGRVGMLQSVLRAELARRQGTPGPVRGRPAQRAVLAAPAPAPAARGGYVRRRRVV